MSWRPQDWKSAETIIHHADKTYYSNFHIDPKFLKLIMRKI